MSSKVVIVRAGYKNAGGRVPSDVLQRMFSGGLSFVSDQGDGRESDLGLGGEKGKIGIKINTIGGQRISTDPETAFSLAKVLVKRGTNANSVIIWDRTNRELKEAGYKLHMNGNEWKIFGTDTRGVGYGSNLTAHRSIGSLFSAIQADLIAISISLAILKDHGLAGVTAGMKNYFGAIHNPNKYHDSNCNPYIADLFDSAPVKQKHRMTILDALTVQYHRGPSFHAEWAEKCGALVFSRDPVAADCVGWQIIEKLRFKKGLPSLKEENREPEYLHTAARSGLGTADGDRIQIIETEV